MTSKAEDKLQQILDYPLFQAVGTPLGQEVSGIRNWSSAARSCGSKKWEACQLMARNFLQREIEKKSWDRIQLWNPTVRKLKEPVQFFVEHVVQQVSLPPNLLKNVRDDLAWSLIGICLESEYSDIVAPVFYIPLLDHWYAKGHFPCGWDGDEFSSPWNGIISGGQLIVF